MSVATAVSHNTPSQVLVQVLRVQATASAIRLKGGEWVTGGQGSVVSVGGVFRELAARICASGTLAPPPVQGYLGALRLPSSSGPGRRPLTAKTGVRVPQGAPKSQSL